VAFALAQKGATVHLLHVSEPAYLASPFDLTPVVATPPSPDALAALEKKVTEHLKRLVPGEARARGVHAETHVVHDVNPSAVIQRVAQQLKADAIVVGTHGRSGLSRLVMGSVAADVLKSAKLPVILARSARS